MDQSGNSTASSSCSSWSLMASSQTSTKVDTNNQSRSLFPTAISSGFKIHCLRTLLVFLWNDAIKTKEFPELNADQAKFMQLLFGNVNIDTCDSNREVTELYGALVHAVRINELKYEVRIKCNERWGGKKSVVFEKVPVLIQSGTAVNSDQTADKSKQSVAFKTPVPVSSGSALNSDQMAGKSKETMEVTRVKTPMNISGSVTCTLKAKQGKEISDGAESQSAGTNASTSSYCNLSNFFNRFSTLSTPRKPKVNVQNALRLAATDNIKLDKVINLNQSLRSKKKDKKRKKAELYKAKKSEGASSSSSTSRDSSRDRVKGAMAAGFVPPGPKVTKRPSNEISQSPKKTFPSRPNVDMLRNEKLREALSVPVQSDKAMRMMLGMGWNGGALGARGDGITEPLMPALEIVSTYHHPPLVFPFYMGPVAFTFVAHTSRILVRSEARGAGFGLISHRTQNSNPDTVNVLKKLKEQNSPPPFVQKTKQLPEDVTFDTIPKPSKSTVGLQKPYVEPSKPTTSKVELRRFPTQTRFSVQKLENPDLKLRLPFRMEILQSIWDLINSDASCKTLEYDRRINKKEIKFVTLATRTLRYKKDTRLCIFSQDEIPVCEQIRNKYQDTKITVEARFFWNYMSIDLLKLPKNFNPPPTPIVFENNENTAAMTNCNQIINSENLLAYIFSTNGTNDKPKTIKSMQFKVLFLMIVLKFVKSLYEEYEVTFNKILSAKEKSYIENAVDQINMRRKFGSSPAESKLGDQIREHVKDAFLGVMYDKHTTITLSKYYRFKRLNRPDNVVRRKTQATVNLDDFTSETIIEPKLNADKPFHREIKYDDGADKYQVSEDKFEVFEDNYEVSEHTNEDTETDYTQVSTENTTANVSDDETSEALPISNQLGPYDSDDSSVEEYNNNNANAKVPKLLPGEEAVNVSNFLYLYDKDKTNTAGIRNNSIIHNDSACNVTENRNSKNNSGNGNVVIDNNDNQFIDMKRAGGNAQDTQKENNVDSEQVEYVICVDYKEEEIKSAETSIQINTEPVHGIFKDDSNVVIKKDESKTVININNSNAIINLDDTVDEINKDKSKVAINRGDPTPVTITGETIAVIDKDESQAVIDIDKSKAVIEIDESKAAVIQGKSKEVIIKSEPMAVINQGEAADVINKDVSEVLITQGE